MEIDKNNNQISMINNAQKKIRQSKDSLSPKVLAKQVVVKGENKQEFYDYVAEIREELYPSSKIEEEIFKKYIFSGWKLRRAQMIERNLINKQQVFDEEELVFSDTKRRIRNIKRIELTDKIQEIISYQEKLERQMTKTLKQLRDEQKLNLQKPVDEYD
jgi:hypothetical protein